MKMRTMDHPQARIQSHSDPSQPMVHHPVAVAEVAVLAVDVVVAPVAEANLNLLNLSCSAPETRLASTRGPLLLPATNAVFSTTPGA